MSRCAVCKHAEKKEIERLLVEHVRFTVIAKRFGMSNSSVSRHYKNHLIKELSKVKEATEIVHAKSLLNRLVDLQLEARKILSKVKEEGRDEVALKAIKELSHLFEIEARVTGELRDSAVQVNITQVVVDVGEWLEKKHNDIYMEYKKELITKYEVP